MEIITHNLVERATRIAVEAHKTQIRKSDGSPYIVHPLMVARIVELHGFPEVVVAAALVHDVLEDTAVTEVQLRELLGDEVLAIVIAVSEDKTLPWKERKERYIEAVLQSSEYAKAVSVADKIHNAQSLLDAHAVYGSAVWEKFNQGRELKLWFERTLCDTLNAHWQHSLIDEYQILVTKLEQLA